jgi:crossover junction endodeoxyribonuclease RuvC
MRSLGVDVGINGAGAIVEANGAAMPSVVSVIDLPTIGSDSKRRIDARAVYDWVQTHQPQHAFIEHASARPGQGVSGIFRFARAVGSIEAAVALAGIPVTIVAPAKWKAHFGLIGDDKENDRLKALQLFPSAHELLSLKKYHQRADAILLALYGARHAQ